MKPRKVVVTIELTTDRSIKELKDDYLCASISCDHIHQVQVNVVKPSKPINY